MTPAGTTARSALVVGATGIVGRTLAERLVEQGWEVRGLSRRTATLTDGVEPVAADLSDRAALTGALADVAPTHVFVATWSRQESEEENCRVNGANLENLFAALAHAPLEHVALVTGLKHYLGPFENYAKRDPVTPFREEQERVLGPNSYYVQEDVVRAAAAAAGFTWSVHRPHTLVGCAVGNVMNIASTLAACASLCRRTGRPFTFPGSPTQWNGLTDLTDAGLLADQLVWAATTEAARDEAFNTVNGEHLRWSWLWPRLAAWFGLEAAEYPGRAEALETRMADMGPVWDEIVTEHGLQETALHDLASWWHTDGDLGRDIECFTDMTKSRVAGFGGYRDTTASFLDVFARLADAKVVPDPR